MHKLLSLLFIAAFATNVAAQAQSDNQDLSYALGLMVGSSMTEQLKSFGVEIKVEDLARGFKDGFGQARDSDTIAKAQNALQAFQQQQRQQQGEQALQRGAVFLADNGKRDGVITTASGLQYEVLSAGNGKQPSAADNVTVHYRGTLIDGTEFDSSFSRGQPASFQLDRVIPGWTEGVQLMKEGATFRFFVPAGLAYGERGAGANIGPNETLIFDVELIKVGS
ncbi:MAG: FKBP-type peptidyl-prolyl cis-trans isomerase [Gammaproteobacteria bacterium]|nr:FKBP-type peptidyl-prolyl cis-trans isomerase [Gammaproteobacteria bacterium]